MVPAHDARYDSCFSDKVNRHECLGITRVEVFHGIRQWVNSQSDTRVYWMNGTL
ncbi:hypothetical protein AG1IA_08567 [Rhizoctonia solani AG-1 IA]|uniref:Uncharacterized protein n=1 Tax=Thanatephorus cucumeris (strain AG1-IA) TaxID=983506 RepID=L8WHJ5_THACA|nr:hypothetical protein AG1IA_08567 [Rhizoctonia solani AG-1 IA]